VSNGSDGIGIRSVGPSVISGLAVRALNLGSAEQIKSSVSTKFNAELTPEKFFDKFSVKVLEIAS
jgi:hypothetical protein